MHVGVESLAEVDRVAGRRRPVAVLDRDVDRHVVSEHEVAQVEVPLSYADQLYALRVHIELVREKLENALERVG